ncbi:MAG: ribonuclease [Pseudomonadota bacterium]|nr:ribonuclease [Pseudomonadota bacterium]
MSRFSIAGKHAWRSLGVVALAIVLLGGVEVTSALARGRAPVTAPEIALADLPREARDVYARIQAGGPFRYDRDGIVFGNRERLLPGRARGYYHEYTVPTPGERTRGAQRIICGGPQTTPEVCFYTNDHYRSFRRIRT